MQPEDFNEFHTPCHPDRSNTLSSHANFTVAFNAVMTSSGGRLPQAKSVNKDWNPTSKNNAELRQAMPGKP